jgi:hypothetical protein
MSLKYEENFLFGEQIVLISEIFSVFSSVRIEPQVRTIP